MVRTILKSMSLVPVFMLLSASCTIVDGEVLRSRSKDAAPARDAALLEDANDTCHFDGPCPLPSAGTFSVCGRAYDLIGSQILRSTELPGSGLQLTISSLSSLGAIDEPLATTEVDRCGWFVLEEIPGSSSAQVVLTTDDNPAAPENRFSPVASIIEVGTDQIARVRAFALRSSTASLWSETVGQEFFEGAFLALFSDLNKPPLPPLQGAPLAGATLQRSGLTLGRTFYFSDSPPLLRSQISDALGSSGADGSALITRKSVRATVTGTKLECTLDSALVLNLASLLQVQEILGRCN